MNNFDTTAWESHHTGTFAQCAGPCEQGRRLCPSPQLCQGGCEAKEQAEHPDTFAQIHFWGTTTAALCVLAAVIGWAFKTFFN